MERKPFEVLSRINVNDCTKNKNESVYLQWASAWAETKKNFPDADYTIWKDEQHRPYIFDSNLGYMVFTTVTIEGETKEMWLPVLDASKNALKDKPYTVTVKKWDDEKQNYMN